VMKALQMVGSGVMATANATLAMHDDIGTCQQCNLMVKRNEQCPMCKQHVY